ncbi:nuclear pore complex protein Nup85 [Cimex lectularius]|uniref:Nuclear pore complex protein Nup85 n=1 Tax=Cimex lectularius TaxID=79782 RepID=A0A8I6S4C3_CIMLE|nr:nuclear pore complex protein Nup85 [Cimex lectularius]
MDSASGKPYIPCYEIKNEFASKLGPTFTPAGATGVAIHSEARNQGDTNQFRHIKDKIHFVQENSILHDPELRKLINESNSTFISSRTISVEEDYRKTLIELSREHRSTIRQCIENMQCSMKENSNEMYNDWVEVLDNIDHIWHLCELLYIECIPGDVILPKLLEWIRLHSSSDYDYIAAEVLSESHTKGANHRYPNYWDLIYGFLLEGRIDAARALLKLHSDSDKSAYLEADLILQGMPKFNIYCGLSVPEFTSRWRGWKSSLQAKILAGTFLAHNHLHQMMLIIVGGESSLSTLKPYCSTWYQLLVAYLLYNEQTVKIDDLSYHANKCFSQYKQSGSLKILDQTLLALFEQNIPLAIKKLQLTPDGGWCALHLTNLLDLAGVFEDEENDEKINLEKMFLSYGQLLMSHQSYWQVAMTYFEQCHSGVSVIETILKSMPLRSKNKALRMISVAQDYGLEEVANGICKQLMVEEIEKDNLAGALTWAIMSENSEAASNIADKYLEKYALGQTEVELMCCPVLANMAHSVLLLSGRLTLLIKYCEFVGLYEEMKWKEAVELLIRLLESKVAPKYFWLTLLIDSLPLLTEHPELFSHDDVTILLASLEEVTTDVENSIPQREGIDEQIKYIRYQIAKCFSYTLLKECCDKTQECIIKCD